MFGVSFFNIIRAVIFMIFEYLIEYFRILTIIFKIKILKKKHLSDRRKYKRSII